MGDAKVRGTFEQRRNQALLKKGMIAVDKNADTRSIQCECGSFYWVQLWKLCKISGLSPKNPTGQDQLLKEPVFVCGNCGTERPE